MNYKDNRYSDTTTNIGNNYGNNDNEMTMIMII